MAIPALAALALAISASPGGAYEASLATSGDAVAVAWHDTREPYSQIYARWLDDSLQPKSAELRLTTAKLHAYEPSLQIVDGRDLVVAWYDKNVRSGRLRAHVGMWNADGTPRWTVQLSSRTGRNPVVRAFGQSLFCAWLEYAAGRRPAVWGAWLTLDGQFLQKPRQLAAAGKTTWNLNAAIDASGRAWVVFDARFHTKRAELFLVVADRHTENVVRLSADDRFDSVYPAIALNHSQLAITWFDRRDGNDEVYLYVAPDQMPLAEGAVETNARRITHNAGHSIGAYLSWNGVRGGLAWCDDSAGHHEVYFQPFDVNGPAEVPRRLSNERAAMIPSIVSWRAGFVLGWNEGSEKPTVAVSTN